MTFCLIRKIKRRSFPRWPQPIICLHLALPSHQLTLIFFHYIHKSLLCSSSSPPAFQFQPHPPSTQTFTVPPPYTSKPSQSFLPGFVSKTSNVCLPSLRFLILSVLIEENLNLSISSSSSSASCPHLPSTNFFTSFPHSPSPQTADPKLVYRSLQLSASFISLTCGKSRAFISAVKANRSPTESFSSRATRMMRFKVDALSSTLPVQPRMSTATPIAMVWCLGDQGQTDHQQLVSTRSHVTPVTS